jgi:hypothetical protein
MSADIANCPFCGSKASMQTQYGVDHWVQCESDTCASTNGKTTTSRRQAIDSWNRRATPSPDPTLPPQLRAVHAFLDGSAPLDGVWFGEKHPTERGQFWWRKHLRDAAPTVKASQSDTRPSATARNEKD